MSNFFLVGNAKFSDNIVPFPKGLINNLNLSLNNVKISMFIIDWICYTLTIVYCIDYVLISGGVNHDNIFNNRNFPISKMLLKSFPEKKNTQSISNGLIGCVESYFTAVIRQ